MQMVPMYTIRELLATPAIKWNQTKLAGLLHINRSTLRKYMNDTDNKRHSVLYIESKYRFMHATTENTTKGVIYG